MIMMGSSFVDIVVAVVAIVVVYYVKDVVVSSGDHSCYRVV